MRVARNWLLLLFCCLFAVYTSSNSEESGFCSGGVNKEAITRMTTTTTTTTLGGLKDSNSNSNDLAQFAVNQHNTKNNALLEFVRVIKSQEQVVAGTLHHLTLEVLDAGNKKIYEAKIWVKPWLNFKELQEFTHIPSFTSSDLGANKGDHVSGWKSVPIHDPVVQDAANHAVNTIQQRSNSLLPYTLNQILDANAQVVDASAKFDMLLKVNRGDKEEIFKVEVHRNNEGAFHLNQMKAAAAAADHS